jgi:hypothetical protein
LNKKSRPDPLPLVGILLSVLGIAGFVFLFLREFNIYWLILSPVIFVVYQFPAFAAFWLHKKRRRRREAQDESCPDWPEEENEGGDVR